MPDEHAENTQARFRLSLVKSIRLAGSVRFRPAIRGPLLSAQQRQSGYNAQKEYRKLATAAVYMPAPDSHRL